VPSLSLQASAVAIPIKDRAWRKIVLIGLALLTEPELKRTEDDLFLSRDGPRVFRLCL
jgi:hypothetical protein